MILWIFTDTDTTGMIEQIDYATSFEKNAQQTWSPAVEMQLGAKLKPKILIV